ncbi:MAG: CRISPR-associated helicase Cas3' [Pontiellaceae bacterium]|nr:CRISPR-associated helicase Cas3' [Pontiellaceae bacterium]
MVNGTVGISVYEHCRIAGVLAEKLLSGRLDSLELFSIGTPFLVAVHDVGKVSPGFLKKCSNEALLELCPELAAENAECWMWNSNHAEIGEAAFRAWAKAEYNKSAEWLSWAEALGVHHGRRSLPKNEGVGPYGGEEWAEQRQQLIDFLFHEFGEDLPEESPTCEQVKLLAGLTCVSDWIASNEDFFPNTGIPAGADLSGLVQNALTECGWTPPLFKQGLAFADVFPFSPNSMQQAFIDCVDQRGVYVLEAPMGQGKTEAALFAAYQLMASEQNSGLYFGLPTRLTSDRIHLRVNAFMDRILENPSFVKLVHGHAWMDLESNVAEFRAGMGWFHPRKRALLAPFGVGTIDQALMSVLKVKHHFVRTFGLAGKVVILDEVHSYDAYTGTLLNCLVEELLKIGCSVIILSATLTAKRRSEFFVQSTEACDYPLISSATKTEAPLPPADRKVAVSYYGAAADSLVEQAVEAAERGLCVLWIANTVAQSQDIFCRVNGERAEGAFETGLLHSRFPAFRRAQLEEVWIEHLGKEGKRPRGCILVATQVVEQSVDIDADLLITELAPTDMLLQRMGRLCRHDRKHRPEGAGQAWIYGPPDVQWNSAKEFNEALGVSRFVYASYVLWKTLEVWRTRSTVSLPGQIREVLEETYAEADEVPEWVDGLKAELDAKREKLQGAALGLTALYCGEDSEEAAPTRYSTRATIPTLILRRCDNLGSSASLVLCEGSEVELRAGDRDFRKAVRLHQNMVSLPAHWTKDGRVFKPTVPAWLKAQVYGSVWVLEIEDGAENGPLVDLNGNEVPWEYHVDKGVFKRGCERASQSEWHELEDEDESYY